jgi:ArsR family transcriptional regulator
VVQISKRRAKPQPKGPPKTPKHAARCCGPIDDHLHPELFKALCDPTRSTLLACLAKCGRACSVGEVAECCAVDLSVVSRHLALMARAGLLDSTRQGRAVLYQVRFQQVVSMLRQLADSIEDCAPRCAACDCSGASRAK